jgi:hypothetical protein
MDAAGEDSEEETNLARDMKERHEERHVMAPAPYLAGQTVPNDGDDRPNQTEEPPPALRKMSVCSSKVMYVTSVKLSFGMYLEALSSAAERGRPMNNGTIVPTFRIGILQHDVRRYRSRLLRAFLIMY